MKKTTFILALLVALTVISGLFGNSTALAAMAPVGGDTIKVSSSGHGTISPAGPNVLVQVGGSVSFTFTPDLNYSVDDIVVDGVSQGPADTYDFTNVTSNHTLAVTFLPNTFTITATAGANGVFSPTGSVPVNQGSDQTFSIIPNTGFRVLTLTVDNVAQTPATSLTFTNVQANHTIAATFTVDSFTVTPSKSGNGTITPSTPVKKPYNSSQTFTMAASSGSHIVDVQVDEVSQGAVPSYTFSGLKANHSIFVRFGVDSVNITESHNAGGSVSPSGVVGVPKGTDQTFTITPDETHSVDDIIVDGVSQGPLDSYTFTSVTTAHTIQVVFIINTYTITATAGPNGVLIPGGSVSVDAGSNKTISVTPNTGYHITGVIVDGQSQGVITSYTFTNVLSNHTMSASFAIDTETITASTSGTGTGTVTPAGVSTVLYNGSKAYTIAAGAGSHLLDVSVNGVSKGKITSFNFTGVKTNQTINAIFGIDSFTITPSSGAHGSIAPSSPVTVTYNGSAGFEFLPDQGYHVVSVLADGIEKGPVGGYSFDTVKSNHTINVSFARDSFTVTASAGANGSISPSGATRVVLNDSLTYTITPASFYRVADVLVDESSVGAVTSYKFSTITANHSIFATFVHDSVTITASAGANGSISPSGAVRVSSGSSRSFTITPNTHYHVTNVLVDGSSVGAVTTYNFPSVTTAHTISASFGIDSFTIAASAGANGSIAPTGSLSVPYNGSKTFTITPNAHYHVANLLVDGSSVGALTSYTFVSVSANHTISASFAIDTFTITASSGANGTVTPAGTTVVNYNANQTYTITPAAHYHVANVLVDGSSVGAVTTYPFTGIAANHTISASFAIDSFTITASAGANGSISSSGVTTLAYGASKTYTLTPAAHYHVTSLLVDGASVGTGTSYTFSTISANHTISASFGLDTFTIAASAGANGTIAPVGSLSVPYNGTRTFTITPDAHYHIANVIVDGSSVGALGTYTFVSVSANHTISASFAIDTFTITASSGANGSVTPAGVKSVNYGGTQAYTITPSAHYHVLNVLVDGSSVGVVTSYSFSNVTANHTISASFGIDSFTIAASAGSNGSISPSGNVSVPYNTSKAFTITPASHYHIASVLVDGSSVGTSGTYTFTNVAANHTISASFAIDTFSIVSSAGSNGSISPGGTSVVNYGGSKSFTITPVSHYHVANVLVDGSSVGAVTSYSFTNVSANHTISASFALDSFTVTASAGANGSISPSGATKTPYNSSQTYTITPASHYHITGVLVDGSSVGAVSSYTFSAIAANHTISASFGIDTFTIAASAGSNGSISPTGSQSVPYNGSKTFTITPDAHYHVANVLVDGSSVGALTSYTFASVSASHTISATFAIDSFTVTASSGSNGSVTPGGSTKLPYGSNLTYTITPVSHYHVTNVFVDEASVGAVTSYTFSSLSANHSINATLGIDTLKITESHNAGGNVSPSGVVSVIAGQNQTFTITSDTTHSIEDVLVDNISQGPISSYTFTSVYTNHTVQVVYVLDTYTITATAGSNGVISPSGSVSVDAATNKSFTITPNTGRHIVDVLVDGSSVGAVSSYTFTNVMANHSIAASFGIDSFTIAASQSGNGSGSITPSGNTIVTYNGSQSYSIAASTGSHIVDVLVNGVSQGAITSYNFTAVKANQTISAVIGADSFTISTNAVGHGSIAPPGPITLLYNQSQGFEFLPDNGYHVVSVVVDGSGKGTQGSYSFDTVKSNHSLTVTFGIDSFTIAASAGSGGSISPSGDVAATFGSSPQFTITPNAGFHIVNVVVDGEVSVGAVASYTFTEVTANHSIAASFAQDSFSISVTSAGSGSVSPNGIVRVVSGANQLFSFTPTAHNRIDSVFVDGSAVKVATSYQFSEILADHSLRVVFGPILDTIYATSTSPGTLSPKGVVLVQEGNNQTFTMVPDTNAIIVDVIVDGTSLGVRSSYTFSNVTSRHTIDVVFAVKTYTITATATGHGTIVPNGDVSISYGANRSFAIAADTGYHILNVKVDGSSLGVLTAYTFSNVTANHTLEAIFGIDSFTVAASAGSHGSISPVGSITATYGSSKTFTFTPDTGYHVQSVLVDENNVGAGSSYTINDIKSNRSISVTFAIDTLTVLAVAGDGGSITPGGSIPVTYGSSQTVTIAPASGYHITNVQVDGSSQGVITSYTFNNVITNHTITATFSNQYSITATAGSNGSVSPSGTVSATQGTDKTFNFTPQNGFHVSALLVDGESQTPASSYTFTNVQSNHTLSVSFAVDSFTIYAIAGQHGKISPADSVHVVFGGDRTMTITPDLGYRIVEVFVDGIPRGPISTFQFTSVIINHTIQAVFTIQTFSISATTVDSGTVTPAGTTNFNYGDNQLYTITPKSGYHIVDVRVDNISKGVITSFSFDSIRANHVITAFFSNTYKIVALTDANGNISPVDTVTVIQGTDQTFTITPKVGRHLLDVLVDNVSVGKLGSYTFANVMANHKIQARFGVDSFTIVATSGAHGAISPSGTVVVLYDSSKTFTFPPETGYHLVALHVDTISVTPAASFKFSNVTANHTISAEFAINSYTITASSGPHGTITPSGAASILHGGSQTYSFQAETGYHLDSLIVDNAGRALADTFRFSPVTAGHTIRVSWAINQYSLNVDTVTGSGTVTRTPGQALYDHGTAVSVLATPSVGWQFAGWTGDTTAADSILPITMTRDRVLKAHFVIQDRYLITYRTGSYVDWATATDPSGKLKSVSRKANKIDFMFPLNVPIQNDGKTLTINFNGLTSGYIHDKRTNAVIDSFTSTKSKTFTFTPPRALDSSIEVVGRYAKGKGLKITYAWGADKKNTVTVYDLFKPGLIMPNMHNLGEELFPGGPGQDASVAFSTGLLIGVPTGPNNSNSVLIKKYADVKKSMNVSGSLHTGGTGCLVIKKQAKNFPANKVQNHLFAEALTLKLNIASSEAGKLPAGFGVLTYFDKADSSNPFNGLPVARISLLADSALSCVTTSSLTFRNTKLDSVLHDLNSSFAGVAIDTFSFAQKTRMKGARPLIDVSYLRITPNSMPIPISTPGPAVAAIPDEYTLFQNYPNPFNPTTTIEFNLPYTSTVTLKVYNLLGQEVATLVDHEQMEDGLGSIDFDASKLASGVYFYRLNAQGLDEEGLAHDFGMIKKMVLVK